MITDSNQQIEIIAQEDLTIVEDNSTEPERGEEIVEEPSEEETEVSSDVYEVSQLVYGIDVSRWQGDIDWAAVANSGISFVIIKCGGGDDGLYQDKKFVDNIQGAYANGLQVGVYFFSGAHTVEEAYEEASWCLQIIEPYRSMITYPVAFDWELQLDGHSTEEVTAACDAFLEIVASYGYTPMMYGNKNSFYYQLDGEYLTGKYKTWLATYFSSYYYTSTRWEYGDDLVNFNYNYDIWQYGATDTVDGIAGYVDMNVGFFTYSNYAVNGLQDPSITLPATGFTTTIGDGVDLTQGVTATNSIGYSGDYWYTIYDSDNNEVSEDYAINTVGNYIVVYEFKDPKNGIVSNRCSLLVRYKTPSIAAIESSLNYTGETSESALNQAVLSNVKIVTSDNSEAETKVTYTRNNKTYSAKDILKSGGNVNVTVSFKDAVTQKDYSTTFVMNIPETETTTGATLTSGEGESSTSETTTSESTTAESTTAS